MFGKGITEHALQISQNHVEVHSKSQLCTVWIRL